MKIHPLNYAKDLKLFRSAVIKISLYIYFSRSGNNQIVQNLMIEWKNHLEQHRHRFFFFVPECLKMWREMALDVLFRESMLISMFKSSLLLFCSFVSLVTRATYGGTESRFTDGSVVCFFFMSSFCNWLRAHAIFSDRIYPQSNFFCQPWCGRLS